MMQLLHVEVIRYNSGRTAAVTQQYVSVETVSYLDPGRILITCAGQHETFVIDLADVLSVTIEAENP